MWWPYLAWGRRQLRVGVWKPGKGFDAAVFEPNRYRFITIENNLWGRR